MPLITSSTTRVTLKIASYLSFLTLKKVFDLIFCVSKSILCFVLGLITKDNLPPLWHLFLLDALLAKVQVSLEESEGGCDSTSVSISENTHVQDLLPHVLRLTQAILHCTRWSLLHSVVDQNESTGKCSLQDFEGLQDVLAIASNKNTLTNTLASELSSLLPTAVSSVQQQWNSSTLEDISSVSINIS